jgi:PAS domain S-box-containing protein
MDRSTHVGGPCAEAGTGPGVPLPCSYRDLLEASLEAWLLTTPEGKVMHANRACSDLFGYTEPEFFQLGRDALLDPSDPRVPAGFEVLRRTGRFRGEVRLRRKDGSCFPVEASSTVFTDVGGACCTSTWLRDLTEPKRIQAAQDAVLAALDADRRRLQAVLDWAPFGVVLYDVEGRVSFNHRGEELLGMAVHPDRGNAQYANRILYPDGRRVPPDELVSTRVLRRGEQILAAEYLLERPDGSRIPVLGSAAPVRDAAGRSYGAVGVFQDISERVTAERALRASERLLSSVFALLPVGLCVLDAEGQVLRRNAAHTAIWGRNWNSLATRTVEAWCADTGRRIKPEELAAVVALRRREPMLGQMVRVENLVGEAKTLINSAMPLYDNEGRFAGITLVNEDVTKLKQVEDGLQSALEARDEVLRVVAHDLRNPLNAMLMNVERLQGCAARLEPHVTRIVDHLSRLAHRMSRLISDLLDVARLEGRALAIERQAFDATALVQEVAEAQAPAAYAAGLRFDVEAGAPGRDLVADRDRIAQVLENLVANAVKFTPAGGRVRLGLRSDTSDLHFWVGNTGPGIGRDDLPHVFDRFWQAPRSRRRGAGLGLAIVRGIVAAHGGRVWAESEPGRETVFHVVLAARGAGRGGVATAPVKRG